MVHFKVLMLVRQSVRNLTILFLLDLWSVITSRCYTTQQMTKLTRDDVLKLAQLARLELSDEEIEAFSGELTEILQYVEQLQSVDVAGLKPTNQVTGLTNVTRADEVRSYGYKPADLLKQVPEVEADQIKVKRMIG